MNNEEVIKLLWKMYCEARMDLGWETARRLKSEYLSVIEGWKARKDWDLETIKDFLRQATETAQRIHSRVVP